MTKRVVLLLTAFIFLLTGVTVFANEPSATPLAITELYEEAGVYHVTVTGAGANEVTILVTNNGLADLANTESAMQNVTYLDQVRSSNNSVTISFVMRSALAMAPNEPASKQYVFVNSSATGVTMASDEIYLNGNGASAIALTATKTSFDANEDFVAEGTFTATYADTIFTKKNISFRDAEVNSAAFDKTHGGVYSIGVTYGTATSSYDVTVDGPLATQPSVSGTVNGATVAITNDAPVQMVDGKYVLPSEVSVTPAEGAAKTEKVLTWSANGTTVRPGEKIDSTTGLAVGTTIAFDKYVTAADNEATLRVANDRQGIRFASEIDIDVCKSLMAAVDEGTVKITKVGTFIAPKSYFANPSDIKAADFLTVQETKTILDITTVINNFENLSGAYKFGGVMTSIKEHNYNRDFAGVGYIQYQIVGSDTTYYAFADDVVSIGNPAEIAATVIDDHRGTDIELWLQDLVNALNA